MTNLTNEVAPVTDAHHQVEFHIFRASEEIYDILDLVVLNPKQNEKVREKISHIIGKTAEKCLGVISGGCEPRNEDWSDPIRIGSTFD